jgi:hypothetical protein
MSKEEFIESISQEGEIWKSVVGYEDSYMVSNYGRVISIKTECLNVRNGKTFIRHFKPYICKIQFEGGNTDYGLISLTSQGKRKTYSIHRIVATAFIPNPNNYPCVDHIDDNPKNNKADNLQWCSYHINNSKEHRITSDFAARKGKSKPSYIKKPIVAIQDGIVVKTYPSMWEATLDGYSSNCMLKVIRGQQKEHKGLKWMYLSDYNNQT